jgi:hypothetical protein
MQVDLVEIRHVGHVIRANCSAVSSFFVEVIMHAVTYRHIANQHC